jgi:8-amino-7-oxononanoate synthase
MAWFGEVALSARVMRSACASSADAMRSAVGRSAIHVRRRRLSTALASPEISPWTSWLASTTDDLCERRLLRDRRVIEPIEGSACRVRSREGELTVFSSNDYLGLSAHAGMRAAAAAAAASHGSGPRSSALVCGHTDAHAELESGLAELKGCESALLFPTGFAANLAVVGTLADGPGAAVFSDELNHASIVDGARLAARAGASVHIYRHNDLGHLEALLAASAAPRKLIVSDSLFSMDGDLADVAGLALLRDRYGAMLALDEAHASLVYGPNGGGVAEAFDVAESVDVHVGTLSKAFGAHGGFVGCSDALRSLIVSRGRAGIYSTALPYPAVAAANAALTYATDELRATLWGHVHALSHALGAAPPSHAAAAPHASPLAPPVAPPHASLFAPPSLRCATVTSPIVPIVVGSEEAALAAAAALLQDGYLVPAIRPPTVPAGTARLRVALSAAHTAEDVSGLARALARALPS